MVGRILFGEDLSFISSLALVVAVWLFLYRTRAGLILRAVGDNHARRMRSATRAPHPDVAVMFGGACAGLAGAYLSLAYTPFFSGHDRRARLDRAGAGGVRILAPLGVLGSAPICSAR